MKTLFECYCCGLKTGGVKVNDKLNAMQSTMQSEAECYVSMPTFESSDNAIIGDVFDSLYHTVSLTND